MIDYPELPGWVLGLMVAIVGVAVVLLVVAGALEFARWWAAP